MTSMADEIDTLRHMAVPELVTRYAEVFGRPPRVKHREYLWKRVAWKIQERRYGGLSTLAKKRLEELIAQIQLPLDEEQRTVSGVRKRPPRPGTPAPGTVIVRKWRGEEYYVTAIEDGFECDGRTYRSLSAVANAITGSHWNGRLFFGLAKRKNA